MNHNWKSKSQFQRLSHDLATLEGLKFERAVLAYLRLMSETAVLAQARGSLDVQGVDVVVPDKHDGSFELGVQCKGFEAAEGEVGAKQISQCRESIKVFRAGSVRVKRYWLVYNRTGSESRDFIAAVTRELKALEQTGRATSARLLNRDEFLAEVLSALYARFRKFIVSRSHRFGESGRDLGVPEFPIEQVPYRVQEVRVSQYRFDDTAPVAARFGDPLSEPAFHASADSRIGLLLGEFGMGKTTLAFRLAHRSEYIVLYVPAASFPKTVSGTKELLKHFTGADDFVAAFPVEDQPVLERMVRLMSDKLLSENESKLVLVIDGLDESPFLTVGNGFPTLFDALAGIRARAVLTMRTEFWRSRSEALLAGYIGRAAPTKRSERNRRLALVELAPWTSAQIVELLNRTLAEEEDSQRRRNLEGLREKVMGDAYAGLYGDIPRKPLFLRILMDFVAENGVSTTSLAHLFREWIQQKLRRDVIAPLAHGGPGRSGITEAVQAADVVQSIAIQAMKFAARLMTSHNGDQLVLLPQCDFSQLALTIPALQHQVDVSGLLLNSLLMPAQKRGAVTAVRFAHRAFQEYFLARTIVEDGNFTNASLPEDLGAWVQRLREEVVQNE